MFMPATPAEERLDQLLQTPDFAPPAEFAAQAQVADAAVYERAAADPQAWWAGQAQQRLDQVGAGSRPGLTGITRSPSRAPAGLPPTADQCRIDRLEVRAVRAACPGPWSLPRAGTLPRVDVTVSPPT